MKPFEDSKCDYVNNTNNNINGKRYNNDFIKNDKSNACNNAASNEKWKPNNNMVAHYLRYSNATSTQTQCTQDTDWVHEIYSRSDKTHEPLDSSFWSLALKEYSTFSSKRIWISFAYSCSISLFFLKSSITRPLSTKSMLLH